MSAGNKKIIDDARLRRTLFGGVMRALVVSELRHAGIRQAPGGIKADEIGTRRLSERNDEAMSAGDVKQKNRYLDRKQNATSGSEASAIWQPRRAVGRQ